ncbi:MAG: fluoride efflux transporter CrcB [Lentisphaerae bacterium]|nr:MAG: fluoride efflux transporter CrcB [Lentisphaerota bacterium]
MKWILLMMSGGCGALCRYWLSGVVEQRFANTAFPAGTLAVNMLGCFLFGVIWALTTERSVMAPEYRLYLLTGFMGAFTTFSTFAAESANLAADRELLFFALNAGGQVVGGILCFIAGRTLGSLI